MSLDPYNLPDHPDIQRAHTYGTPDAWPENVRKRRSLIHEEIEAVTQAELDGTISQREAEDRIHDLHDELDGLE